MKKITKKITALLIIGAMGLALGACGVKGPLYFPEKEQSQPQQ